jgi:DNA mismatch repair protein MutL
VNIHPTKTEIKFADEQTIWQILQAAVRESLGKFHVAPSIDFDMPLTELDLPQTAIDPAKVKQPRMSFNPNYNPFEVQARASFSAPQKSQVKGWEKLYDEPEITDEVSLPEDIKPMQVMGRYILVPVSDGLMIVDQHRAHLTILFAEIEQQMRSGRPVRQQLLFPETIELSADDMQLMRQLQDQLLDVGFELEQLSSTAYAINSTPALLGAEAPQRCLTDILAAVRETGINARTEWNRQIALAMARDTAVPYGKALPEQEMVNILKQLFALPVYTKTPDGKTVVSRVLETELEKRF